MAEDEPRYLDFELRIERTDDGYRAWAKSPSGMNGEVAFTLPFSNLQLENLLLRIAQPRSGPRRDVHRPKPSERAAIEEFGAGLYRSVFAGGVWQCLTDARAHAREQRAGLRIRLNLAAAPTLIDLPWEYLYDRDGGRFVFFSSATALVRYLPVGEPITQLTVAPPLRLLVLIASPRDALPLDVESEWAKLSQALAPLRERGAVVVQRVSGGTLEALFNALQDGVYHAFHFIGHGAFDEGAGEGMLLLEDRTGRGRLVSGRDLGALLYDHRSLRLAVLNACEGASTRSGDPYVGSAQRLLQQGIPAVVAMQFEISDSAALAFAEGFYEALAVGRPVDAALATARQAIFAQGNAVEWGTPVLYLRAPDGVLFDVRGTPKPPPPDPDELPDEVRERLERVYTRALAAFYAKRWERAIPPLREVVAAQPHYRDAAARLEEAIQQQHLAERYAAGVEAYGRGSWAKAIEQLQAVTALDAGYRDAPTLLREAERQRHLTGLYDQARLLHGAQEWSAVVTVFERIAAVDPAFPDPSGLLASAREALAAAQRERELADLYGNGVAAVDAGAWTEALRHLKAVQRLQPGYGETETLLALTRQHLSKGVRRDNTRRARTTPSWLRGLVLDKPLTAPSPSAIHANNAGPRPTRGWAWCVLQSWWILLTIPFGWLTCLAFFYIGRRVQRRRWIYWGAFYLVIFWVLDPLSPQAPSSIYTFLSAIDSYTWLGAIIHALAVNRNYLLLLQQQEARVRVEQEPSPS